MSFRYILPELDKDQFRIATCNDLIWFKSRHHEFFSSESEDYSKKHYGLGWGLKAFGYYYVLEYLKRFQPGRVLEIGAGQQIFFSDRCRELGLEYWVCDDGHFYSDAAISKHANRPDTIFVYGQVGQYLEALPTDYFDLIFSISVVEHVPDKNLKDFYSDIRRMIKKPINAKSGGRMIHTIDLPSCPGFEAQLHHLRIGSQAGFIVPSELQLLHPHDIPLMEPLEIQYIYYSGKDRDMWDKEMTSVLNQTITTIYNSSLIYGKNRFDIWINREEKSPTNDETLIWLISDLYLRGHKLADVFKKRSMRRIAVYGIGIVGKIITQDLSTDNDIELFLMDKNLAGQEYCSKKYTLLNNLKRKLMSYLFL